MISVMRIYLYDLIRYAQTNINYFPYKIIDKKVRELHKVKINSGLTAKKLKVSKCYRCYSSLLSASSQRRLQVGFANLLRSSSESEARSIIGLILLNRTTSQPSLFLSAVLINF